MVERANLVAWVHGHHSDLNIRSAAGERSRDVTGRWLSEHVGWRLGVSGPYIDRFIELAEGLSTIIDPAVRQSIEGASTLNKARQILKLYQQPAEAVSTTPIASSPLISMLRSLISQCESEASEAPNPELIQLLDEAIRKLTSLRGSGGPST